MTRILRLLAMAVTASRALAQVAPPPEPTTAVTANIGAVLASGNTQLRTMNADDKIVRTDGKWILTQLAAYVYGQTAGLTSANQLRGALRSDYSFESRVSVFTAATYERNRFAGFTRRTDEALGISWKAIVAPMDSLSVDAGGVLTQQQNVDTTHQDFPAARLAAAYKHNFSKLSYFQQLAEYIPDLQSSGEYRVNTETSLVAPLSTHIGIKIAYAVRFNSKPPANFGTTDRLLTTGVQVSF